MSVKHQNKTSEVWQQWFPPIHEKRKKFAPLQFYNRVRHISTYIHLLYITSGLYDIFE